MSEFDHGLHYWQAFQATYAELAAPEGARTAVFNALGEGAIIRDGLIADDFSTWACNQRASSLVMDTIKRKTMLLDAYQPYAPETRVLLFELPTPGLDEAWCMQQIHDDHVADGWEATVLAHRFPEEEAIIRLYAFEGESGNPANEYTTAAELVHGTVVNLLAVEDKPHFERIKAASFKDAVVLSEPALGVRSGREFTEHALMLVTDSHLYALRAALHHTIVERGYVGYTNKVFFDSLYGFTLLNPWRVNHDHKKEDFELWANIFGESKNGESSEKLWRRVVLNRRFAWLCAELYSHYDTRHGTAYWPALYEQFCRTQIGLLKDIQKTSEAP